MSLQWFATGAGCYGVEDIAMYFEAHQLLPEDAAGWSRDQLRQVVREVNGELESWLRALMVLAHNPDPLAGELLLKLAPPAGSGLRGLWEQALAEHRTWVEIQNSGRNDGTIKVFTTVLPGPPGAAAN